MVKILRIGVLFFFAFSGYYASSQSHVVINEVYGGGGNAGAALKNDFIELYNPTSSAVDLSGWSVQYASSAGTTWQVTTLSGTIEAGEYFLVQEAQGTGGTTNLPTPDVSGSIPMAGTGGKVALVNLTTALSGACPTGLVDFVGFGSTGCFEGTGPTAAPSNTLSVERKIPGQDNDVNSTDFQTATPSPRNGIVKFASEYPKIQNIDTYKFQLASNLNKSSSTTYFVVLSSGAGSPSALQIKNGEDASGVAVPAVMKGTIAATTAGISYTADINGLLAVTSYDVYFVSENSTYLQAIPVKVSATTAAVSPPTINLSASLVEFGGYTVYSKQSSAQTYSLTASDLTNDVSLNVTGNYLISKDNIVFQSSISFVRTDFDANASQIVYAKFNPDGSVGALTGTITHSTIGGVDKLVTLSAVSIDPFNQNFNDPAFLSTSGWMQYNVTGAQVWATTNFGHTCLTGCTASTVDKAAQINGFASGAITNEDWLISPQLDITGFVNFPALSFWTISAFDGPGLQLKYSTNYSGAGDPSTATWTDMDGKFPASNSSLWTKSSNIILPKSSIYVALVYTSGIASASRWTLDDWKLEDVSSYIDVPFIQYAFGEIVAGSHSDSKNFAFTARGYGDITLTAPEGYEVSVDNSTFSTNQLITEADALSGKTIYVRFSPAIKKIKWEATISFKGTGLDTAYGLLTGSSFPKSETFNITAYNLEFFGSTLASYGPSNDALQVSNVTTVMRTIGSDIFSIEELSVDDAIDQVVAGLPGYKKIISDRWSYSFDAPDPTFPDQKIGLIYNSAKVNVISSRVMFAKLFDDIRAGKATLPNYPEDANRFYASGRLPFMVTADITMNGTRKRVKIIVLHARAGSSTTTTSTTSNDYGMRNYDMKVLHDSLAVYNPNDNIIIMGDFNDDVDTSIASGMPSTYKVFVEDVQNFNVLTYGISQAGAVSFPSSSSFLDHIIISNELSGNYIANSTLIEDPRTYIAGYTTTTSDHLPVSARFTLAVQGPQTIVFAALPAKTFGDAPFNLTATSTSGLAITYTSSDVSIASVDANGKVTIKKTGTVNVMASQAGDSGYLAATDVVQSLTINKATQTISFTAIPTKTVGDAAFDLTGTSTSSLVVSFSTTSDKVTLTGSQVTIVKPGSVTISASQAGSDGYHAATSVNQTFCINPAKPTITLSNADTESPTLTSSSSTGNQWYLNGTAVTGATNATYSAATAGIYKVQVKTDNCLSAFSNDKPLIVTGDIKQLVSVEIAVHPNPVEDYLTINGLPAETTECMITDMKGRTETMKLERLNGTHRVDIKNYGAGLYLARVQAGNEVHQIKFIKK